MESVVQLRGNILYKLVQFKIDDEQRGTFETPGDDLDGHRVPIGSTLDIHTRASGIYTGEVYHKYRELGHAGTVVCIKNVRYT